MSQQGSQLRTQLRQRMRAQRRALSAAERRQRSERACQALARQQVFQRAQRIACFLPNDGEPDPTPLITLAWSLGKAVYLPLLSEVRHDHLQFAPFTPDTPLVENRFGIPEPRASQRRMLPARCLDLVLTPLVAFDEAGNRLGMGGGYYDRSFAFLRYRRFWRKPRLVGMAFTFQRVAALPAQAWDVPLYAVVTEEGFMRL